MKLSYGILAVCFCVCAVSAGAQDLDKGPYEQQLRTYSEFHGEFTSRMKEENEKKRGVTEELKITGMMLDEQKDVLEMDIEQKETSIERLTAVNKKLQETQAVMFEQYVELEGLFKEQKAENDRLKKELESGRTVFLVKMLEFYEQEDGVLAGQIVELQGRQEDIRRNIQDIKEKLDQAK
jgi:chromosome segregation ATPase